MRTEFEDLYDIEKRPGAGVSLWRSAVELQLERVREANYRHRLHSSPNENEKIEAPEAEGQLHADVYFLALAIRRLLRFQEAFAAQVDDPRLRAARARFDAAAPEVKQLRDLLEHLDEYLLDLPSKYVKVAGRTAPVLHLRWDSDNVVISIGELWVDITGAGVAAVELGRKSEALWDEHLDRVKREAPSKPLPADDGIERRLEVTLGVSTVIGGEDEPTQVHTGVLLTVDVREVDDAQASGVG